MNWDNIYFNITHSVGLKIVVCFTILMVVMRFIIRK